MSVGEREVNSVTSSAYREQLFARLIEVQHDAARRAQREADRFLAEDRIRTALRDYETKFVPKNRNRRRAFLRESFRNASSGRGLRCGPEARYDGEEKSE